jgi:hypothetical protein
MLPPKTPTPARRLIAKVQALDDAIALRSDSVRRVRDARADLRRALRKDATSLENVRPLAPGEPCPCGYVCKSCSEKAS